MGGCLFQKFMWACDQAHSGVYLLGFLNITNCGRWFFRMSGENR